MDAPEWPAEAGAVMGANPWSVVSHEPIQATPPQGNDPWAVVSHQPAAGSSISAQPGGIANWAHQVRADLLYGGDRTVVGKILSPIIPHGMHGGDASPATQMVGGAAIGPTEVLHGVASQHPMPATVQEYESNLRGMNEAVGGVGKTLALPSAVVAPATMAYAVPAITAQSGVQAGLTKFGARPEIAEGAGNLAGFAAGGLTGEMITPKAPVPKIAPEAIAPKAGVVRSAIRSYTGIGPRAASRAVTEAIGEHAESAAATQAANAAAEARHAAATTKVAQRQTALNAEAEASNKVAAIEHAQDVDRITKINDAGQEAVGRRADLSNQITEQSTQLGSDIKSLEKRVRGVGSSKYATVEQAVSGDTVPASNLAPAVRHAQTNILAGTPESIKQFGDLLRRGEPADVPTSMGTARPGDPLYDMLVKQGAVEPTEQLAFRDLQGYYTELGAKMQGENVPGDVYRSLKYVREQVGNEMQAMAERHGVGNDLTDAKAYWHQYEKTFHDMRSVALGGSPVARSLRAADPGYVAAPLLGKASARTVDMLGKYDPVIASNAASIAKNYQEMQSLPKNFKPRDLPQAPTPKTAKTLEMPSPPTAKPLPEAPDPVQVITEAREKRLGSISKNLRSVSGWDIASVGGGMLQLARGEIPSAFGITVLRHGIGAVLDSPRVVEWLSKPTAEDFAELNKLPTPARAKVQDALAQVYMKQAQGGKNLPLPPSVQQFLTPLHVQEIQQAQKASGPTLGPGAPGLTGTTRSVFIDGQPIGHLSYEVKGDTLTVNDIGGPKMDYDAMSNKLGRAGITKLTQQLVAEHPEVKFFEGIRVGGAKGEAALSKRIPVSRLLKPSLTDKMSALPPPTLRQITMPSPPTSHANPSSPAVSGPARAASIAAIMSSLKNGEITQSEADSRIQRARGGGSGKTIRMPERP